MPDKPEAVAAAGPVGCSSSWQRLRNGGRQANLRAAADVNAFAIETGDRETAIAQLRAAIAWDPDDAEARRALERVEGAR